MKRPSSIRELREFGLLVGAVFAALGAWWIYRAKFATVSYIFVAVGALLILFGALAPSLLRPVHRGWMALAEAMSFVMTRVILAIVFYLVVAPIGFLRRLSGADPLRRRAPQAASYWEEYSPRQHDPKHYDRMF
ncbi:MAG TPA: SxtJ family membrane protein [Thermoanaerobaculia bacterium]|nr:SxtJ family membrane protein [Thermoanaerobaculia bacterium]